MIVPLVFDVDLRQLPRPELRQLVRDQLTRGVGRLGANIQMLMRDRIEKEADRIVDEIRNPRKENDGS